MDSLHESVRTLLLRLLPDSLRELGEAAVSVVAELERVRLYDLNPAGTRDVLMKILLRIAQAATDTDCVYLCRVNVDGSLERLAEPRPFWRPGRAEVGVVPRVTPRGLGVSGVAVANGNGQPVLVRDVTDANHDPVLAARHQMLIAQCAPANERTFLQFIRSEVFIPLVVEGRTLAAVVAVRGEPFEPAQADVLRDRLVRWGATFIPLYSVAATVGDVGDHEDRLQNIVRAWPRVAAAESEESLYRQMATILTCDKGLSWHRAAIFRLQGPYPADATCVMAIGGPGDTEWSGVQRSLSDNFQSLEQYLEASGHERFGFNDTLFNSFRSGARPWVVSADVVRRCPWLTAVFASRLPMPSMAVLPLNSDHPFLAALRAEEWGDVFLGGVPDCPHSLVPLMLPTPAGAATGYGGPLGFVLVDRPYTHRVDLPTNLALTRLICDLFSGLLAARPVPSPAQAT